MNYYEHIEAYIEGHLDRETSLAFESAMLSDEKLAAKVEEHKQAMKMAEGLLEIDIMATIEGLDKKATSINNIETRAKTKYFSIRNLSLAASFIGLLGLGMWWTQSTYNDSSLTDEYYYGPSLIEERGEDALMEVQQANDLWKSDDYDKIIQFTDVIKTNKSSEYLYFLRANAFYKLGQSEKAREIIVEPSFKNSNSFKEQAQWLLILIHIQQKKYNKANQLLDQIIGNEDLIYYKQAKKLKQKLNSKWRMLN